MTPPRSALRLLTLTLRLLGVIAVVLTLAAPHPGMAVSADPHAHMGHTAQSNPAQNHPAQNHSGTHGDLCAMICLAGLSLLPATPFAKTEKIGSTPWLRQADLRLTSLYPDPALRPPRTKAFA